MEKGERRGERWLKRGGGEHLIKNEGCGPLMDVVGPANYENEWNLFASVQSSDGRSRFSWLNFVETPFKVLAHCRNVCWGMMAGRMTITGYDEKLDWPKTKGIFSLFDWTRTQINELKRVSTNVKNIVEMTLHVATENCRL